MGVMLVTLALFAADHDGNPVSPGAKIILCKMAVLCRDDGEPPIYFGGWPALAECLAYPKFTPAAKRAVARYLNELKAAGLVYVYESGHRGRNAAYALNLGKTYPQVVDNPMGDDGNR